MKKPSKCCTCYGRCYCDYTHIVHPFLIFFNSKEPFNKDDVEEQKFENNLALLIIKSHLPL
jgi:hypothetical protein